MLRASSPNIPSTMAAMDPYLHSEPNGSRRVRFKEPQQNDDNASLASLVADDEKQTSHGVTSHVNVQTRPITHQASVFHHETTEYSTSSTSSDDDAKKTKRKLWLRLHKSSSKQLDASNSEDKLQESPPSMLGKKAWRLKKWVRPDEMHRSPAVYKQQKWHELDSAASVMGWIW